MLKLETPVGSRSDLTFGLGFDADSSTISGPICFGFRLQNEKNRGSRSQEHLDRDFCALVAEWLRIPKKWKGTGESPAER